MLLNFFVARLNITPKAKTADVFLRHNVTQGKEDVSAQSAAMVNFCFPLGPENQAPKEVLAPEEYTFTLTQSDGRRLQGFCRRFLPPAPKTGSKLRYPQVLCLIAEASWCAFFFKVLQYCEQLLKQTDLLLDATKSQLPPTSYAGLFLQELGAQLMINQRPGQVLRVALPKVPSQLCISPPRRITFGEPGSALEANDSWVDLQIPPDCGNGKWNAGISLARLLWHVPRPAMLTLVASLLLERRVILVAQSRDTVSLAVQAAAALIYPFKWHHIYLPMLPKALKDYLTAPMPFLIGMPAQLLPVIKDMAMDEVVIIDLDQRQCTPAPGTPGDDSLQLPWRDQLDTALAVAYSQLRSPTEYESNPFIAGLMQEYLLKLVGHYRKYIHEEGQPLEQQPVQQQPTGLPSPNSSKPGERSGFGGRPASASKAEDNTLKGHGCWFDQAGFVAHRRSSAARKFLSMFRHSQMYEVFIQERLALYKQGFHTDEVFEQRVTLMLDRPSRRLGQRVSSSTPGKWKDMIKGRHRRGDSYGHEIAAAMQAVQQVQKASPRSLTTTSMPSSLRRAATELQLGDLARGSTPGVHPGELRSHLPDPAMFFEDEEDEELELAEAELQASGHSTPHIASRVASSNNLADLCRSAEAARKPPGLPDKSKVVVALGSGLSSNGSKRPPIAGSGGSGSSSATSPRNEHNSSLPNSARSSSGGLLAGAPALPAHDAGLLQALTAALGSTSGSGESAGAGSEPQLSSILHEARHSMHSAMSSLVARTSSGFNAASQHLSRMVDTSPRGGSNLRKTGSLKEMAAAAGMLMGDFMSSGRLPPPPPPAPGRSILSVVSAAASSQAAVAAPPAFMAAAAKPVAVPSSAASPSSSPEPVTSSKQQAAWEANFDSPTAKAVFATAAAGAPGPAVAGTAPATSTSGTPGHDDAEWSSECVAAGSTSPTQAGSADSTKPYTSRAPKEGMKHPLLSGSPDGSGTAQLQGLIPAAAQQLSSWDPFSADDEVGPDYVASTAAAVVAAAGKAGSGIVPEQHEDQEWARWSSPKKGTSASASQVL